MCEETSKYTCDISCYINSWKFMTIIFSLQWISIVLLHAFHFLLLSSPHLLSWMSTIMFVKAEYCSNENINSYISYTSFPIRHRNTSGRRKETDTEKKNYNSWFTIFPLQYLLVSPLSCFSFSFIISLSTLLFLLTTYCAWKIKAKPWIDYMYEKH